MKRNMYKGKIYFLKMDKDLEVYIDADFEKKWDKEDS